MFEVLIKISSLMLPVFVFLTMLNVGLTQEISDLIHYLKNRKFALLRLVANFLLAPLLLQPIFVSGKKHRSWFFSFPF